MHWLGRWPRCCWSPASAWPHKQQAASLGRSRCSNWPARRRAGGARVEVVVGALDPRLKLAPCARITPYVPAGARLWGRSRVGLRCDEGARWNVFVPVTVKVFANAWSVNQALPPGTLLEAGHLSLAEVDLAAEASPVIHQPQAAIGRTLTRGVRPGQAVREADLKPRQWFAAGDTVRVSAPDPASRSVPTARPSRPASMASTSRFESKEAASSAAAPPPSAASR